MILMDFVEVDEMPQCEIAIIWKKKWQRNALFKKDVKKTERVNKRSLYHYSYSSLQITTSTKNPKNERKVLMKRHRCTLHCIYWIGA